MDRVVGRGIDEWAKAMGWSASSLRRAVARDELGYARLGRRVIIPAAEMEKFLAARTGKRSSHPVPKGKKVIPSAGVEALIGGGAS